MAFPDEDLEVVIEAYLGADPNDDPGTWPSPVDLSSRLLDMPVTVRLGRQQNQKTAAAGSCSFWLDNDDGHLTPLHGASPYYGTWDLGVPVAVDVDNVGSAPPYPQFRGYVVDITADMVPGQGGQNISAVRVTLGGILRRLGQGAVAKSSLRRKYELLSPAPSAYWSLEGAQLSTVGQLTSGSGGAFVSTDWGTKRRVEPGVSELAPWLGTGLHIAGDTTVALAPIAMPPSPTRVAIEGTFVFDPQPGVINAAWLAVTDDTTGGFGGNTWFLDIESLVDGTRNIVVFGGTPSLLEFETIAAPTVTAPGPHHVRLDLQQSGGNIVWTLYLDGAVIGTASVAGTLASFPYAQMTYGTAGDGAITFQHVAVYWNVTPPSAADITIAVGGHVDGGNGYVGEPAHTRISRRCTEEGIPFSTSAGISAPCGRQPHDDFLVVVRECEAVDQGMLTELTSTWGLGYRALSQFYNQSAAMTIDLDTYRTTAGTSADVLSPIRNDQRIRNEWTVNRPDGGEVTVKDEAHQAKRGRYNDSATVNLGADQQLPNDAAWRVKEGTQDLLRQQAVPVDVGANPTTLLQPLLDLELGDRIDRTNHLAQHPPQTVSLQVQGYTSVMRRRSWRVGLVVEPYDLYRDAAVYANPTSPGSDPARYAHPGSTLTGSENTTDTSFAVTNSPAISWGTLDLPYDLNIGGERVTCTAVSGTGASQTLTVTRSVNGISKSHDAGTPVQIWRPVHYARIP